MHLEFGSRVRVMGILNTTPDSFSDGGRFLDEGAIAAQVDTKYVFLLKLIRHKSPLDKR